MKRKEFINRSCSCGALSLLGLFWPDKINNGIQSTLGDDEDNEPINKNQVRELLKFIDSSINEEDKKKIFNKLGFECLYSRNYDRWVIGFRDNLNEFFDRVQRGESKYWEKLEYDKDKAVITLIGRKFQACVCEYGHCDQPPESLCKYCCKRFQEEMFGLLFEKKVTVRIDESIILGGVRCSATIFIE